MQNTKVRKIVATYDGTQGLYEGKNREDSGYNDRNKGPGVFEVIMHEHCSISWPIVFAIFVYVCNKMGIVEFFDKRVIVKLIEDSRSVIDVQVVVDDPTRPKYLHVFGRVNEVV
ncbi:hypothetical protein TIFTF001_042283 [Ficus carica]|uniref:Uncharacterized protein n=1 Tax=Ficus carica TaxID=3494 RepID=A0AA87ZJU8_FICCA|nr:hypothetical protein TIFTF001_042283 [Ficus carica]